jgi:hypothetical protein
MLSLSWLHLILECVRTCKKQNPKSTHTPNTNSNSPPKTHVRFEIAHVKFYTFVCFFKELIRGKNLYQLYMRKLKNTIFLLQTLYWESFNDGIFHSRPPLDTVPVLSTTIEGCRRYHQSACVFIISDADEPWDHGKQHCSR